MESSSHHIAPRVRDVNRAPAPKWQEGEVVGVVVETPETNTLKVRLSQPTAYLAGQYFNIRIPIEGRPRPIQRAYSVGSSPTEGIEIVDFGIRETEGGLVSPVLVRNTPIGTKLEVRGPYGDFTWQEMDQGPVLLVGAGSGVVPLKSIIRYALDKEADVKMALLYSSKSAEYVIYDQELSDILSLAPWLKVFHTFTRDANDTKAHYHRRIDKEMIAEIFGQLDPKIAYICGPPEMVEDAEAALIALGMDPKMVKSEKYD